MSTRGFSIVPNGVLEDDSLSQNAISVYVALSYYANERMQAWPSRRTLSGIARVSVKSVGRALKELRDRGLVTWVHQARDDGGQSSSIYVLGSVPNRSDGATPRDTESHPPGTQSPTMNKTHIEQVTTDPPVRNVPKGRSRAVDNSRRHGPLLPAPPVSDREWHALLSESGSPRRPGARSNEPRGPCGHPLVDARHCDRGCPVAEAS